jgi:acyl-coenzyme A synthetase/AMP-(fatty) acid ligase
MVSDCAVIGVYDKTQVTELPRAYVALKQGSQPSDALAKQIMKFVADQVVSYKQLRSVRFIDVIPKSPAGKILRRLLRDAAHEEEKSIVHVSRI